MSQRLIKILAPKEDHDRVATLLQECGHDADWTEAAGKDVVFSVLLSATDVEPLLDRLTSALPGEGRLRAAVVKVESSLPAQDSAPPQNGAADEQDTLHTHAPILRLLDPSTRISRDELRAQLGKGAVSTSPSSRSCCSPSSSPPSASNAAARRSSSAPWSWHPCSGRTWRR
jgi:hypothetical protein